MEIYSEYVTLIGDIVWGPHMLILLIGTGIYFTIRLKLLQFGEFRSAIRTTYLSIGKSVKSKSGEGDVTSYQALMTALGGAVGNGNIAGVATAIAVGGPGAIFWMWISAFFGMASSFVESTLGVHYRQTDSDGRILSGPMYYIKHGLGWGWLASIFALFMGIKTLFSTPLIQGNSMTLVLNKMIGIPMIWAGIIIAILTWFVIIRGIDSIAVVATRLSPFMVIIYLAASLFIIIANIQAVPGVFGDIIRSAFTERGATGGFAGASVMMAMRYGVARGVYSNEAGTGSAPIVHGAADVLEPRKQGAVSMIGVLIDTLVINTMTALVILLSGEWISGSTSTDLAAGSFMSGMGSIGGWIVALSSLLFGYSTLIAWPYYGEQCFAYLFGGRIRKPFRWAFCIVILFSTTKESELIWAWGDILNGMMAIPNLIAILALGGTAVRLAYNGKASMTGGG